MTLALIGCGMLATASANAASSWAASVELTRQRIGVSQRGVGPRTEAAHEAWQRLKTDFPVEWDWMLQDAGPDAWSWLLPGEQRHPDRPFIERIASELFEQGEIFVDQAKDLANARIPAGDRRWLELYARLCEQRRDLRLQTVRLRAPTVVFVKQRTVLPSFFAYTEGQSDAQNERHFHPGATLCRLDLRGSRGVVRPLLADPQGALRDPAVSWNGDRVLFAWKKGLDTDDYHLYELNPETEAVRQITHGLGFADYEPTWLPNDHILFSSTRCVQTVDCWWTEVSNLYTCDAEGRGLRRLGFDQVHAIFPQVLDDGRIIYTRWDYNDRGQIFPQPLFQMLPDGTGQTEFYGNNSWFPTTIAHARGIPGTQRVLAILCGHHSAQVGKLAVIDPALGRQENAGVQLVAPIRHTPAERIDSYGQEGPLWQYPYPLSERECLTAFAPLGWSQPNPRHGAPDFAVYWMDWDGRRELLAYDPDIPSTQPVPLMPRSRPAPIPSRVDYSLNHGTYYLQDIYAGDGLQGVPRGTIHKLRVVALDFRAAGVGNNGSSGPGGAALVSTPIAIGNGSWDVKRPLGEVTVHPDGSAFFQVPARTPVYFQALDGAGRAVQTMRSWSTLQPGEVSACVGCHEHKNTAPPVTGYETTLALAAGLEVLTTPNSPAAGFSFRREIQPILDRHCIGCHQDRAPILALARGGLTPLPPRASAKADSRDPSQKSAFSLLGTETVDPLAKRRWSDAYLVLTRATPDPAAHALGSWAGMPDSQIVNWISPQSVPTQLPPNSAGSVRSQLLSMLAQGHRGVSLSPDELRTMACWIDLLVPYCGDYEEANAWAPEELEAYRHFAAKRRRMEQIETENIRSLLQSASPTPSHP